MRITSKGQVTIPQHLREKYALLPDTEVDFVEREGQVVLVPTPRSGHDRGDRVVARLRGTGRRTMSTAELLALTRD
jgi:AbrB family looped-hinge helix DNA binding protein